MARTLQHIQNADIVHNGEVDGEKITAFCGARIYPMTRMKSEIPTCSKCTAVLMKRMADHRCSTTGTYTVTWNMSSNGGAA